MSSITIVAGFATPTSRQRKIDYAAISMRNDPAFPFVEINRVTPANPTITLDNIDPGDYEFQGVVFDEAGKQSTPVGATASVGYDDPSPLVSLTTSVA